jgi:hypothetical protein
MKGLYMNHTGIKKYFVIFFLSAFLISGTNLFAQETLGELSTQMEIQGEMQGQGQQNRNPAAPKKTNQKAENKQGMDKLDKIALKLMQSMQSGKYEQADFAPVWNTLIQPNTNFSDGLNAMVKTVFDQYGKPEKLGQGKMTGNNSAAYPVQFTTGTLNMVFSLDAQDKILDWKLLPTDPAAGAAPSQNAGKNETQTPAAEQPKDSNTPDIKDFNAFQRELNRINIETRGEEEQWLSPLDKKAELARSIDELVISQLRFVRKLAETEHSEQTIKAIDLVIRQRQERLNKLITKLDDTNRQERQQKALEQQKERRTTTQQTQTERPAPRTQQRRPARDANMPGQPY